MLKIAAGLMFLGLPMVATSAVESSAPASASGQAPTSGQVPTSAPTSRKAGPVVLPPAQPPYYRVRYEASSEPGELVMPANYTVWIPPGVKAVRGVIVHQHGCGEGAYRESTLATYDLHWQALARKWDCVLIGPTYEHPPGVECAAWCVPSRGSDKTFLRGLGDLAKLTGHPELATAPWVLWGHSGGGNWSGQMVLRHPERVAAVWMRSGAPYLSLRYSDATTQPSDLAAIRKVPMMVNPGVKEQTGEFAYIWKAVSSFYADMSQKGLKMGWAVDPTTAHDCGNSRYLAIRYLDECMAGRLPDAPGGPLRDMEGWQEAGGVGGWFPSKSFETLWQSYVETGRVTDTTAPPAPTGLKLVGSSLTWEAEADLESGLAGFIVMQDGLEVGRLPQAWGTPAGSPHLGLLQGLNFHDTPRRLPVMKFEVKEQNGNNTYSVKAVNTAGLESADCSWRPGEH